MPGLGDHAAGNAKDTPPHSRAWRERGARQLRGRESGILREQIKETLVPTKELQQEHKLQKAGNQKL